MAKSDSDKRDSILKRMLETPPKGKNKKSASEVNRKAPVKTKKSTPTR